LRENDTAAELFRRADQGMYRVKGDGKERSAER
jgi:hypothetical protein